MWLLAWVHLYFRIILSQWCICGCCAIKMNVIGSNLSRQIWLLVFHSKENWPIRSQSIKLCPWPSHSQTKSWCGASVVAADSLFLCSKFCSPLHAQFSFPTPFTLARGNFTFINPLQTFYIVTAGKVMQCLHSSVLSWHFSFFMIHIYIFHLCWYIFFG